MSDTIFYVGVTNSKISTAAPVTTMATTYLYIDGAPVVDPIAGGSRQTDIYPTNSLQNPISGTTANRNNCLIMPAGWSQAQADA